MAEHSVSLRIGTDTSTQLRKLEKKIVDKLYNNFIHPIRLGYLKDHLEGKYKPSWEFSQLNATPIRTALANLAKKHSLYHYHFGHPYYQTGNDNKYPGKVSDGIVHTIFKTSKSGDVISEEHSIYHIDSSHPHPFRVPTNFKQEYVGFNWNK